METIQHTILAMAISSKGQSAICSHCAASFYYYCGYTEKDSEAVLGVWLPAPLPTPRALPDHGALWPLAVGVEKDLGGIDV